MNDTPPANLCRNAGFRASRQPEPGAKGQRPLDSARCSPSRKTCQPSGLRLVSSQDLRSPRDAPLGSFLSPPLLSGFGLPADPRSQPQTPGCPFLHISTYKRRVFPVVRYPDTHHDPRGRPAQPLCCALGSRKFPSEPEETHLSGVMLDAMPPASRARCAEMEGRGFFVRRVFKSFSLPVQSAVLTSPTSSGGWTRTLKGIPAIRPDCAGVLW